MLRIESAAGTMVTRLTIGCHSATVQLEDRIGRFASDQVYALILQRSSEHLQAYYCKYANREENDDQDISQMRQRFEQCPNKVSELCHGIHRFQRS